MRNEYFRASAGATRPRYVIPFGAGSSATPITDHDPEAYVHHVLAAVLRRRSLRLPLEMDLDRIKHAFTNGTDDVLPEH